jgi:unsaturated chondroitin disaccharide hydrolase
VSLTINESNSPTARALSPNAEQRAAFSAALDLLAEKLAEDERELGVLFPYVTGPDGRWRTMSAGRSAGYEEARWTHGNWFCGFWVGLHLAAHLRTGDAASLETARQRMQLVAQRKDDPNTHDIGFIFLSSALPGYAITGDPWFAEIAVAAAERLRARLVATQTGAYIAAWGPLTDPRGRASSAIDTMANIPLLYWAARHTGDDSFRVAAEAHARKTESAFIRADGSTYHAVEYDPHSGARQRGHTFQGYSDESFWSRGQGWAVLGFAATAAANGNRHDLDLASRLADVFLDRLDSMRVPPWDFDDPAGEEATRDSSAAAIMADALLAVSDLHPDQRAAERRYSQALAILENLCTHCLAAGPDRGLLRHGCYSKPHGEGTDSAVLFGDFYFARALCRVLMPGRFAPVPAALARGERRGTLDAD